MAAPLSDHVVLQRGQPIPVWGTANPGESVTVSLGSTSRKVKADAKGSWRRRIAAIAGRRGVRARRDVARREGRRQATSSSAMSGSAPASRTWNIRCGGRSTATAKWRVRRTPQLRLMKVPQQLAEVPKSGFAKPPAWRASDRRLCVGTSPPPATSWCASFRSTQKVPIGAIDDSLGRDADPSMDE